MMLILSFIYEDFINKKFNNLKNNRNFLGQYAHRGALIFINMNKKFNNLKNNGSWVGVGTAIGVAIGVATNEPTWIALGVAIGAALGWKNKKK